MISYKKSRAFTLIEILICISLLAIILSLSVVSLEPMIAALKERSPETTLKASVKRAFEEASYLGKEVALSFDYEKKSIVLREYESAKTICEFEFSEKLKAEIEIIFIPIYPNSISKNSKVVFNMAKNLNALRFSPDGSMTPAQIILTDGFIESVFLCDGFSPILLKNEK